MKPHEYPDMTIEEIKGSDEWDTSEMQIADNVDEEMDDHMAAMAILGASNAHAKMFADNKITLREYIRLSEYLVEWEQTLEHSPLK